jgi:hypothetical protein
MEDIERPDPTLYSSIFFLTNSVTTFYFGYMTYSILFFILFLTSILVRLYRTDATFLLDKTFVNLVTLYGGYILYKKLSFIDPVFLFLIVSTFIATVFLFYYGYITQSLCYDKDKIVANSYHSLLHTIASVGHHLIVTS